MNPSSENFHKLILIKLLHTSIWVFYVTVIFYIVYAGVFDIHNLYVWIATGLVIFEGGVLLLSGGKCPLTPITACYTDDKYDNPDIFLPNWLARRSKTIFTTIFLIGASSHRVSQNVRVTLQD